MNFERGFPFPKHGNGDTWNSVARGMPIPRESGTVCNQDSLTATAGGNADTTEGANGIVQRANDWKPATHGHGTSFPHRNNSSWTPVTPDKLRSVGMQEKESGTDNWQDLIGMYTGLLKEETVDNTKKRTFSTSSDATSVPYFLSNDPANWKCNHLASIVCSKSSHEPQNYGIHLSNRSRGLQVETNTSKRSPSSTSMLGTRQTHKLPDEHTSKGGATSSTITDSVPLAPITPAKHNDSQRVAENVNSPTNGDSPPSAVSTTHKEHIVPEDKEEQGVDLSKTPQQKTPTRRKKHRPRVIKPKKPNKDQKDGTTPGETRVKRKYVRRKGVENSETQQKTPGTSVGKRKYVRKKNIDKTKGQQQNTGDDTPVKSCRKQLNFDLGINLNVNPQDIEQGRKINGNKYTSLPVLNVPIPKTTHHAINVLARNMNMSPRENGYHMVPANLQKMQHSISLDERRGIKRQNSAMDSLFLYQKLLLGVAHRAHDHNIFLENNKKIKIQSEFQEPSRQMNGIYGNGSMMQLLHPYGQKVNPTTTNVINCQYRPESLQFHTQGHVIGWNQPPPIPPKVGIRYGVITYPATLLEKKQGALSGWRVEKDEVSVEYVTYKLQRMHIYDDKKKRENELVLYRGSNAIVPFEPIKKRNQRPKVDLDPETDRLWRLLMEKEGSEGGGGGGGENLEKDKEKWWENERRVFRGRADSFIARMHLVQGDRRFSRWKGSVVDSVIGVFLTQNVSDHLSSSAFMALAAKFPLKTSFQDGGCEKPIEVAEEEDIIKCHKNIKEPATEDSFKSSTVQIVDEIRSSSGSNSEAEDLTAPNGENGAQKQEAEDLTTACDENGAKKQESAILEGIPMKVEESSKEQNVSQEPSSRAGANMSGSGSNSEAEDLTTAHGENGTQKQEAEDLTTSNEENGAKKQESAILEGMPIKVEANSKEQNVSQEPPNGAGANTSSSGSNSEAEDLKTAHDENGTQKQESAIIEEIPIKVKANSKEQNVSQESTSGAGANTSKEKKRIADDERNIAMNWDSLRKQAMSNGEKKDQSTDASDSLDYEAFRHAPVNEISDAIKERGMNNLLAERMQNFLNRLVRDHGKIDLEWLRDAPPEKAKEYLLSFRGLGLKSVECVRLLTLHHLAFPVDTNVGRIAVRLGWVPLQPLPESLQLHLLEMYPVLDSIQKYLWPRLCKLDQLTLYELHYQMITFGKVFCTKSKPNCNACPMRAECRHFASAFASARLALPGPEGKKIVASNAPIPTDPVPHVVITPMPLPEAENKSEGDFEKKCEPIIEEPTTPEPEATELTLSDIEEQYYEDSDEIPTIKLNMEEFTTNLQSIMQDKKLLQDDMSKALVALSPSAAYIPTPKLKDVSRLRTEHQVYELPDSHRLLEGLEKREPDDPSPYLLAIWTPGETANSIQPPERECSAQESGRLCEKTTCFSCNSIKEANSQVVRGTILIPCRTAMRGSFPLNGTYFQVNEMFADHASSLNPIDVPRAWIWNLPRRTVYFGTSVSTIFRGLSTQGIQYCFWKGFVCVRGFDRKTRAPRPLMARLHFPASKLIKIKNEAK